jgi:hypothetical protein
MLQKLIILLYARTLQIIPTTCDEEHTKLHLPVHNQMEALYNNISKMQSIPPVHKVPAVFFPVWHYKLNFERMYPSLTATVITVTSHIITIHYKLPTRQ